MSQPVDLVQGTLDLLILTFLVVSALLMLAAMIAAHIPARRAARLDPMAALRH